MSAKKIMEQIRTVLADYDARIVQSAIDSIPVRRARVAEVRASKSEKYRGNYGPVAYAWDLINAAGGKGWNELLRNSDDYIIERIRRDEAMKAEARAAKIASKLDAAGIVEVVDAEAVHSRDGFSGIWRVMTDKGPKRVKIEVIGAGGYAIQCFHIRVLCSVK